MRTLLLLACIAPFLSGCANSRCTIVFVQEAPVQPAIAGGLDAIRYPAQYRAYYIGRGIDPADHNTMHEAHRLFVREVPDRWNLHPVSSTTGTPSLTNTAPPNAAYSPLPVTEELKRELNDQRRATQELIDNADRLGKVAEQFGPAAKAFQEQNQQSQRRYQALDERLRLLEETLRASPNLTNRNPNLPNNHSKIRP